VKRRERGMVLQTCPLMPGGRWSELRGGDDDVVADVELLCDVSVGYHADVRVMRSPPTRVVRGGGLERSCGCYAHDNGFCRSGQVSEIRLGDPLG
jgi:hypothetical protein